MPTPSIATGRLIYPFSSLASTKVGSLPELIHTILWEALVDVAYPHNSYFDTDDQASADDLTRCLTSVTAVTRSWRATASNEARFWTIIEAQWPPDQRSVWLERSRDQLLEIRVRHSNGVPKRDEGSPGSDVMDLCEVSARWKTLILYDRDSDLFPCLFETARSSPLPSLTTLQLVGSTDWRHDPMEFQPANEGTLMFPSLRYVRLQQIQLCHLRCLSTFVRMEMENVYSNEALTASEFFAHAPLLQVFQIAYTYFDTDDQHTFKGDKVEAPSLHTLTLGSSVSLELQSAVLLLVNFPSLRTMYFVENRSKWRHPKDCVLIEPRQALISLIKVTPLETLGLEGSSDFLHDILSESLLHHSSNDSIQHVYLNVVKRRCSSQQCITRTIQRLIGHLKSTLKHISIQGDDELLNDIRDYLTQEDHRKGAKGDSGMPRPQIILNAAKFVS